MGAVRLSPPITILAIVVAAMAWLALTQNVTECAYSPEGKLRWNHMSEWFQNPDSKTPVCDVWKGIEPHKPIGIIEINYGSAYLRIYPDGMATAVMLKNWRDNLGYLETLDVPRFRTETELRAAGYTILESRAAPEIYRQVRSSIAPMRDFSAYRDPTRLLPNLLDGNEPGTSTDYLRDVLFDLDDPATKVGVCRHKIFDSGAGWMIYFWDAKNLKYQSWSFYQDIGCADPAARSGRDRANWAARLIMAATNSTAIIEKRNENFSPSLP